jgi:hypothetical protein
MRTPKHVLAVSIAGSIFTLSPMASAGPAPSHDPHEPFWLAGQLKFHGAQGTLKFGTIPCPAGEAFHLTQLNVIPTHTPLAADQKWTITMTTIGNLGWKRNAKGDDGVTVSFTAPLPFATGTTLAQRISVELSGAPSKEWRYFTVGLLGICKVLPPSVPSAAP